ncbi:MAG: TolC family protein, partial [Alistipes sp.]|nr:TolC family protein [Alistipes sp.]
GMQHHLADAVALEQNGIVARAERLYAEVHTAEAERELLKAQKTVETLLSALSTTLNTEQSYRPATEMFILQEIEPVSYFKENALAHNPQLKEVGHIQSLATENMRLQRADFAPQVALMGTAALYNYQLSSMIPHWAVGAGVTFKIFDGLHREYKYSAARWQIRQAEAVNEQANHNILTLIDKLYNEMVTSSEKMPSIDASYRFALEYLRIKEQAFNEGMAPSSDVVDAQLNLAKIRTERLQAAYYYDLMLARLLEAAGISDALTQYAHRASAKVIQFETQPAQ